MKVHYCDVCGIEMTDDNQGNFIAINHGKNKQVIDGRIEMMVEGISNPDLCKYCVFDVMRNMTTGRKRGKHENN